jgi:predicted nucleotidyltransferase
MTEDVCNDAIRMALERTKVKCHARNVEELIKGLKDSNDCYHSYFRFYIMIHILECLASKIKGLRAVYLFGSTVNDTSGLRSDINLILSVGKKDPKTKKTMDGINDVLTEDYKELLGLKLRPSFRLLDIHYITDKDVKAKSGAAALLGSVHEPPMLIWKIHKGVCKA